VNATTLDTLAAAADLPSPEHAAPSPEPIGLLRDRLDSAAQQGVTEAATLALATSDASGHASNRIVRVLQVTPAGLVFTSHSGSQKGRELAATNWASGVLYWREINQQVILTGPVEQLSRADSDALWAGRPIAAQAMSAASRQSAPLDDEETLRADALRLAAPGLPLPRPESWSGYLLVPATVEFWQGRPDGLHLRWYYERVSDRWNARRLQP
jgi:pyridoxamine-phosphate oxidase